MGIMKSGKHNASQREGGVTVRLYQVETTYTDAEGVNTRTVGVVASDAVSARCMIANKLEERGHALVFPGKVERTITPGTGWKYGSVTIY